MCNNNACIIGHFETSESFILRQAGVSLLPTLLVATPNSCHLQANSGSNVISRRSRRILPMY